MSKKVSNPNAKDSHGFLWAVGVLLVIVAVVIGYIVWNGQRAKTDAIAEEAQDVAMKVEAHDGIIKLQAASPAKDAVTVDLFEDFSCPHCAELAEGSDAAMKDAIEQGKLVVNIHTLNFLDLRGGSMENYLSDQGTQLSGHSTRAVAALMPLAESGDAYAYWNLRKYLMEKQQAVSTWEYSDFADAAKRLGADKDAVGEINAASDEHGNEIGRANAKVLKDKTGSVSSPRILKDGKDIPDPNVPLNEWNWVDEVLGGK